MPTFPTLASGSMKVSTALSTSALAMYPATLRHSYVTRVVQFIDDSEQRWTTRGKLFSCVLSFHDVGGYDTGVVLDFFRTMRGKYVNTSMTNVFDITIDGTQYLYCAFDQDELAIQAESNSKFSFQVAIRQLRPN